MDAVHRLLRGVFAVSKIRVQYTKEAWVKYISHLDLLRTFHRAVRRAGIPIKYSQGFNPHPLMSFGMPLPVATTSECEYLEMDLTEKIPPQDILEQLNIVLPQGLGVRNVVYLSEKKYPKLSEVNMAAYDVHIELIQTVKDLLKDIEKMMLMTAITMEKKGKKGSKKVMKQVNIRPFIHQVEVVAESEKSVQLKMVLSSGSEGNLKPALLLEAMEKHIGGIEIEDSHIHRKALWIERGDEKFDVMEPCREHFKE